MSFDRIESALSFASTDFWRASWQASILAIVVVGFQSILGKRLGARGRYALWTIVLARLLLPALPSSHFSAYPLVDRLVNPKLRISQEHAQRAANVEQSRTSSVSISSLSSQTAPAGFPPQAAAAGSAQSWTVVQTLALVWIAGASVLVIRVIVSCFALRRAIRKMVAAPKTLIQTVEASALALGVRRMPTVLVGESVRTPAVVGLICPRLLLPENVLRQFGPAEIRLIVMHELAHLKRWDLLANWFIALATILHWFNPIVWLTAARMRSDREIACDEFVLSRSAGDPRAARDYGLTLVRLIEILAPARNPAATSGAQLVGILESTRPMQRRVRMIARFDATRLNSRGLWIAGVLMLLLGCAALTDSARGQGQSKDKAQDVPGRDAQGQPATTRPTLSNEPIAPREHPGAAQTDADLQRSLQRVVSEFRFDNVPFSDAIDFLREQGAVNLVVNWRVLESAGIARDAPVSQRLDRVTIEQALEHLLKDVGGANVALGFSINNGAIVVSTDDDLSKDTTTVFYDVSDLLVTSEGQPLSGEQAERKTKALIEVISETVAPDSWRASGGAVGSIEIFNGKLVVQQMPKNQQLIEQLLARLREKPTTQPRPLMP